MFGYDEATLRSLVTRWVELADHYHGSLDRTAMGAVRPPGADFASEAVTNSANSAGKAYTAYLTSSYWYCVRQAQLLQDTLDDYLGVERHNVIEYTRPGSSRGGV